MRNYSAEKSRGNLSRNFLTQKHVNEPQTYRISYAQKNVDAPIISDIMSTIRDETLYDLTHINNN